MGARCLLGWSASWGVIPGPGRGLCSGWCGGKVANLLILRLSMILKTTSQMSHRIPHYWNMPDDFLMERLVFWVIGKKFTEVKFNFIKYMYYQHDL